MKKTAPTGSFGLPDDIAEEIRKSKAKGKGKQGPALKQAPKEEESYTDSESIPEKDVEAAEEETKLDDILSKIKKELGVEISEDDFWDATFNDGLTKENVVVVPGKIYATFKTITMDEDIELHKKLSSHMGEEMVEQGYRDLQTKYLLSYCLLGLRKEGEAIRSLGETPDQRFEAIGKMTTLIVGKLGQKWNAFTVLLDSVLKSENEAKKS